MIYGYELPLQIEDTFIYIRIYIYFQRKRVIIGMCMCLKYRKASTFFFTKVTNRIPSIMPSCYFALQ